MHRLSGLALVCTLAPASAQGPLPRALGVVVDRAGQRVAHATVTLVSWPLPTRTDLGGEHRLEVLTDADGRFATPVLAGRSYSAWAHWRDDSGLRRTVLSPDLTPGAARTLREGPAAAGARVKLVGGQAFERPDPLRVAVRIGVGNPFVQPLLLDRRRQAELPLLPATAGLLEVRTARGQLVAQQQLQVDTAGEIALTVPEPFAAQVHVVDEAGKPIAGALVGQMADFGFHDAIAGAPAAAPLGSTSSDGKLSFLIPSVNPTAPDLMRLLLRVEAAGHQPATTEFVLQRDAMRPRTVTLLPGRALRGRLLGPDGQPIAAGITLLAQGLARTDSTHPVGGFTALAPMPIALAADGTFASLGLRDHGDCRLLAVLEPALLASLQTALGSPRPLPPVWCLADNPPAVAAGDLDLGDLRLDRLDLLPVDVVQHDGGLASGAVLRTERQVDMLAPLPYVTDHRGRLLLPVPPGADRVVAFQRGGGAAVVPLAADRRRGEPLVCRLSRPHTISGRVVDEHGTPVADAEVLVARVAGDDRWLELAAQLAVLADGPTAGDGAFAVSVGSGGMTWTLRARRAAADPSTAAVGPEVAVDVESADVGNVVLTLPASAR